MQQFKMGLYIDPFFTIVFLVQVTKANLENQKLILYNTAKGLAEKKNTKHLGSGQLAGLHLCE